MAGAWGTGNGSPGAAKYDNFQLAQSGAPPVPVTNLALNKSATQVSTYSTAVASRAVDGNTDGSYYNNSVTHTLGGSQEWWQADLGNSYALETIKVWNRTDCCSDRLSNFYVFVSDQPFSSYDLTTTLNQSGVSNFYTAGQGGSPTYINLNRTGRYLRVQLSTPGVLSLAEVQVMGSTVALANINWLVSDQLGTPRMIFDKTGALATTKRHDYLPFGEELFAGTGGRTGAQGYGAADGVRQKFTQKERDIETGLDYFIARCYLSTQGRFTSPDEFAGGPDQVGALGSGDSENQALPYADITNPQSLNKYQYTFNNPLRYTDSDGHDPQDPPKPGVIQQIVDKTNEIVGALLRNFERSRDQVPQEEERRGPLNLGDKQIQTYMDAKGRAAESAMDIMEYGDFTGAATTYRGVATGDRSKTVMGVIGMAMNVAPGLKPVSAALEKVGLKVITSKAGVMTVEGTASQVGKLFNLLRGGHKVDIVKPGVYVAKIGVWARERYLSDR